MKPIHKCKDCNKVAEPNKEESNENWIVYDAKCAYCGGEVSMTFDKRPWGLEL